MLDADVPGYPLREVVGEVVASTDPQLPVGSRAAGWADGTNALAEFTMTDVSSLARIPDTMTRPMP